MEILLLIGKILLVLVAIGIILYLGLYFSVIRTQLKIFDDIDKTLEDEFKKFDDGEV